MRRIRVIPVLQYSGDGLVKTLRFRKPKYVGDPINAVRIFNEKEVDELAFIDITATVNEQPPPFEKIREVAGECFMPLAYGGGIRSLDDAKKVFDCGFEKVILNTAAIENPEVVTEIASVFGTQSVVGAIDVKKTLLWGYRPATHSGTRTISESPVKVASRLESVGVGELLVTSINRDGTRKGYDHALVAEIVAATSVPVIACGGAGQVDHLGAVVRDGQASAVAAGSLFVLQCSRDSVLINYPSQEALMAHVFPEN